MSSDRDCIWCYRSGAATVEDVVPQWIARLFRERFWPHGPNFAVQRPGKWHDEDAPRTHSSKRIKIDLRICATCNNVWMSGLESKAKPILSKLIFADAPVTLTQSDADVISAWSAKTLINVVFERHRNAHRLVPPELRDLIREHEAPTPEMSITAFRVTGLDTKVRTRVADFALRKRGGRRTGVVTVATLLVGRAAVQMVLSPGRHHEPVATEDLEAASLVLWPKDARPTASRAMNWPTAGVDGEDAFEALCFPNQTEVATWFGGWRHEGSGAADQDAGDRPTRSPASRDTLAE